MRLMAADALWMVFMLVTFHHLPTLASSPDSSLDLSSQNLSSVPRDLPTGVELLDLSLNNIQYLHKGDFENTTLLRRLNASWNCLEQVNAETFLSTPLLEGLDLSHNRLTELSGQTYLLHTRNLLMLNLTWNSFDAMTLGSAFGSLVKLKRLALEARNISVGAFKHIAEVKLQTLTLRLGEELRYEADSLKDVQAQRLQLTFSQEILAGDLYDNALSYFSEVELMNLTNGYRELSDLLTIKEIRTSELYLTNIAVKWNALTHLINTVLQTSITHLDISDMAMSDLPFFNSYVFPKSRVTSFSSRNAEVKTFFFSQEALYNFFINLPVKSVSITETSIIHMTCPWLRSPILQLDFSFCALSDSIFSRVEGQQIRECETLENVRKLILVGNNLKNLQLLSQRMQHMKSLQDLDLSLNSLFYKGLDKCVWPQSISNMTLSSNRLTEYVFVCLPEQIEVLDLQNNQVSFIPSSIIKLENLTSLNLNSNRLRDLPVCDGFPNLSTLLLRSNSILAPSVSRIDTCTTLKTLDVSYNPFTCTCALRSFIHLAIQSESKKGPAEMELFNWPSEYYCTYPENVRNTILKDITIPIATCNVGILAAIILCPAIVLILAVVTLCHRLDVPWYMGMIWKWTRAKHRALTRQVNPEDMVGVRFHAFVSYSNHDSHWVHNALVPNLEGPAGGLRLCLHEKHFVAGKTIVENIVGCVERSRRSLFVLSAHFVKSEWCHYELFFANHQRLSRGSDSIVLVLLEPLPQYTIPSKYYQLKNMMKRHTYLEWPQDRAKHRLFWANLRAALQDDVPEDRVLQTEQ